MTEWQQGCGEANGAAVVGGENAQPSIAVSVIIPHYNDLCGLQLCLSALERQTYRPDRLEIIVADNASSISLVQLETIIAGRAQLVTVAERGAGPARNGAVVTARGRLLAFTDSDCCPEPEWLTEGIQALRQYDFVGGRVRVSAAHANRITAAEAFEKVFAFDFQKYINRKRFSGSGNLFCSREMFEKVGPFRTGVSEDVEWSHRAISKGFRLGYAQKAVVWHPARRDWGELSRKWRRINRETYGLSRATRRGRIIWFLKALALPLSAVIHSPRVFTSPELQSINERLSALSMLYRLRFWRGWDALQTMKEARSLH